MKGRQKSYKMEEYKKPKKNQLSRIVKDFAKEGVDFLEYAVLLSVPIIFLSSCYQRQQYYPQSEKPIDRIVHLPNITELKYGERRIYYQKQSDGTYKRIKPQNGRTIEERVYKKQIVKN